MKIKKLLLLFFLIVNKINAQYSSEVVSISETYSSNGKFKLQSISYDNEFPNLKGRSFVTYTQEYDSIGIRKKFYQINRSFDLYDGYPFFAAISNDGRKIMYIINEVYNKGAEETNVTYYVDGKLQKTYKTEEFINCNKDQEKCEMFFNNQNQIVYTKKINKEGVNKVHFTTKQEEEYTLKLYNEKDVNLVALMNRK